MRSTARKRTQFVLFTIPPFTDVLISISNGVGAKMFTEAAPAYIFEIYGPMNLKKTSTSTSSSLNVGRHNFHGSVLKVDYSPSITVLDRSINAITVASDNAFNRAQRIWKPTLEYFENPWNYYTEFIGI